MSGHYQLRCYYKNHTLPLGTVTKYPMHGANSNIFEGVVRTQRANRVRYLHEQDPISITVWQLRSVYTEKKYI